MNIINQEVELMLSRPGRYAVSTELHWSRGIYFMAEVDEDGKCYQLNPKGERDGELIKDGWTASTIVYATGPDEKVFVRLINIDKVPE